MVSRGLSFTLIMCDDTMSVYESEIALLCFFHYANAPIDIG